MPDAWEDREDLATVDVHIAAGERLVAKQSVLIEQMAERAHDTAEAERLLQDYEHLLQTWRRHRQLMLDEIMRQEGREPEAT
ncbi:hypothetical protein FS320_32120 [Microvirga tunisiensis]|uniref:Uncharacterized protein n=1 Tax=Microvirga tunisiensis TaxID=2108360 RepID=A0A5N7MRW3_9HYPH|nr:hypothetical protein [Microvirga tunisiensis]MPR29608.1 hypothetical protein [Microvirga tunisiensis]